MLYFYHVINITSYEIVYILFLKGFIYFRAVCGSQQNRGRCRDIPYTPSTPAEPPLSVSPTR